ncbi:MAG: hypothetical protein ACLU5J_06730 [Christensenellales bacterium]
MTRVEEAYDKFLEIVASQSEEVMENIFQVKHLSNDEIISGLWSALLNCDIFSNFGWFCN